MVLFFRSFEGVIGLEMVGVVALAVHAVAGSLSSETRWGKLVHRANVRDVVDGSEQVSRLNLSEHRGKHVI